MQNPGPKIVFVVRLSAIGDTLIAAKTVQGLIQAGHTPVLCTGHTSADVALAIPNLKYCVLNEAGSSPKYYTVLEHDGERALNALAPSELAALLKPTTAVLDLQNTRRSKRFIKVLKKDFPARTLQVHSVQKHTLRRSFLVAKSFFVRKQVPKNIALAENKPNSLFCPPHNLHRVAHANESLAKRVLGENLAFSGCRISPPQKLPTCVPQNFWSAKFVVLCPGASLPLKSWDVANFAAVAQSVVRNKNANIVLIGGPAEQKMSEEICRTLPTHRALNLAGKISLGESLTVLSKAAYVVSGDSFPGHACDLLGVPATILFGATSPHFGFAPEAANIRIRWLALTCSPCTRHGRGKCRFGNLACLAGISPQEVLSDMAQSL